MDVSRLASAFAKATALGVSRLAFGVSRGSGGRVSGDIELPRAVGRPYRAKYLTVDGPRAEALG
jgi:hypothetical protein